MLEIATVANQLVLMNGFTNHLRRFGFAKVKVEIDAMEPLLPGILI